MRKYPLIYLRYSQAEFILQQANALAGRTGRSQMDNIMWRYFGTIGFNIDDGDYTAFLQLIRLPGG
jgi:hypothetical protein